MNKRLSGFTLIELLIVVAIIAILAAIAVPNFLEAQVRSKVSRVKADQRTYATAMEAYNVDHNQYPPWIDFECASPPCLVALEDVHKPLSTPVSYMVDAYITEPFNGRQGQALYEGWDIVNNSGQRPPDYMARDTIYLLVSLPNDAIIAFAGGLLANLITSAGVPITYPELSTAFRKRWFVGSPGPDTYYSYDRCMISGGNDTTCVFEQIVDCMVDSRGSLYDPTNGTTSRGELVRSGEGISGNK